MENREPHKASGLTFATQFRKPNAVFIQSNNIPKCIACLKKHALKSIIINSGHKYKHQHLHFLKENPFITSVEIETDVADCSALNHLNNLIKLSIHHSETVVDFSNFPKLETLNLTWSKNLIQIEKCKHLRKLTLWNYPYPNLSLLESFPRLDTLAIYDSKIQNLDGLKHCKKLSNIALIRNRNLESLEGLSHAHKTLTKLDIQGSGRITDYLPIAKLTNLADLNLLSCGASPSASFIEPLRSLQYGNINIDIIDGQVAALLEKPIIFKNHKHFSHKNTLKLRMNEKGQYQLARK